MYHYSIYKNNVLHKKYFQLMADINSDSSAL